MIHSYVTRILGSVIVGGLIIVAAAPATATAIVTTSANSGPEIISSQTPAEIANEAYLSSRSNAWATGTSTNTVTGALPSCAGPSGTGCANAANYPEAGSYASANGNKGTLKVGAVAINGGEAQASASAALRDRITLTSTKIGISIDINKMGGSDHPGPGQSSGSTNIFFSMRLVNPNAPPEGLQAIELFAFEIAKDAQDQGYIAYLRDEPGDPIESGSSIPGVLNFEIDLSDEAFGDLFTPLAPGFPAPFLLSEPLDLEFLLRASASCDGGDCVAVARADESLYVKVDGTSESGYSYPGREGGTDPDPNPDPDPVGVPEPMSALLLLSGLLGLAGLRRFRA